MTNRHSVIYVSMKERFRRTHTKLCVLTLAPHGLDCRGKIILLFILYLFITLTSHNKQTIWKLLCNLKNPRKSTVKGKLTWTEILLDMCGFMLFLRVDMKIWLVGRGEVAVYIPLISSEFLIPNFSITPTSNTLC